MSQTEDTFPVEDESFPAHLDVRSPSNVFELPCGLILDGKVERTIHLREISGIEEEILAGRGFVGDRLTRVIANCITEIAGRKGSIQLVQQMAMLDRMYLLIALRRVSLGDAYQAKVQCPDKECGHTDSYGVNLAELEITPMPDPSVREFSGKLPSGKLFSWHVMTGSDEKWIEQAKKRLKGEGRMTIAIVARLDTFDGQPMSRDEGQLKRTLTPIATLGLRDRNFLRSTFEKNEGNIDTELEFTCKACENEFTAELEVAAKEFFFPSV